jgi:pyrroline-5-carboxylate reductase
MSEPIDTLGIVGVGGLAGFLVEGLRRGGDRRPILLSPRNAMQAAALAQRFGCRVAASNQAVVDGAAIVIVATPPKVALETIQALAWRAEQVLVCAVIDVDLARLRATAPVPTIVRAMPSSAVAIGLGATPLYPGHPQARRLFETVGAVYELDDEAAFDAATALAGYYLWTFALMDTLVRAAEGSRLPRPAAVGMVAGLTRAAAAIALNGDLEAPVRGPLDEHGKPGTMTAEGWAVLAAADAFRPWREAYAAALGRLRRTT